MVTLNTQHVRPEIQSLLYSSPEERILIIEQDNWIGYPRAKAALNKLEDLYKHPQRQRMPNLLLIGPTNNGKSMILEKFNRDHPPIKKMMKPIFKFGTVEKMLLAEMPIVLVQMSAVPDLRRFFRNIFDVFEAANNQEDKLLFPGPQESDLIIVLKQFQVKMLVIDEIHNILVGRNDKQHEFLNFLRYLGNTLIISIVCVGTRDAYLAIRSDAQLENRFEPFLLPSWTAGEEFESLLASIVSILPLKYPSHLNYPRLSRYILEKS